MTLSLFTRNETFNTIAEQLPDMRRKVYHAIRDIAPCTRQQVAQYLQIDINQVTGRVTELKDQYVLIRETNYVRKADGLQSVLDVYPDEYSRQEAIYARKISTQEEIRHLEADLSRGTYRETTALINARIRKLQKDLKRLMGL